MSTVLVDLPDRIITDTGAVVAKHALLLTLALDGVKFDHLPYVHHPDILLFHKLHGTTKTARRWVNDGIPSEPDLETFSWVTPESYNQIDVPEYCIDMLTHRGLQDDPDYVNRLELELERVEQTGMADFIRCLLWITDTMRENNIPWGLGRGSSCASLVMFLIGVNKVDPVRYDIPMEEFYK